MLTLIFTLVLRTSLSSIMHSLDATNVSKQAIQLDWNLGTIASS
jgi:hypothetical protein